MTRKTTRRAAYSFKDRLRSIPTGLRLAGLGFPVFCGVLLGAYFVVANTGLWRVLALWQADDRGTYHPTITGVISVLVPAGLASLPGLAAGAVLVWFNVFPPEQFHPELRDENPTRSWARNHVVRLLSLNAGSFLFCAGLVLGYVAFDRDSLLILVLGLAALFVGGMLLVGAAVIWAILAWHASPDFGEE